ncbi:MAG: Asr1405/Asl0597 family protein [Halothece sp.]
MNQFTPPDALVSLVIKINRSDRWRVSRRLQELNISCWCPQDGTLWVEIDGWIAAILLHSTVQHFTSSRYELAHWLERCWQTPILSTCNH